MLYYLWWLMQHFLYQLKCCKQKENECIILLLYFHSASSLMAIREWQSWDLWNALQLIVCKIIFSSLVSFIKHILNKSCSNQSILSTRFLSLWVQVVSGISYFLGEQFWSNKDLVLPRNAKNTMDRTCEQQQGSLKKNTNKEPYIYSKKKQNF